MPEDRLRYRLSVSPELNERLQRLTGRLGLQQDLQTVYVCMGLGLRMMEQLTETMDQVVNNPQLLAAVMTQMQQSNNAEADTLMADAQKQ